MTLSSRLSRLQAQAGSKTVPAINPATSSLKRRLAHLRPERVHSQSRSGGQRLSVEALASEVNGKIVAEGLIKIEAQIPLGEVPGNTSLVKHGQTPVLPGETRPSPALYIDTETTGLSGGSGTLAFLVGVAEVKTTGIQLTQFLMTSFGAEAALLSELGACVSEERRLVSYNGKSYDLPLLASRYRMQGLVSPFDEQEHLDLLHPIRRLFGKRWEDCRLTTVERRLLGFSRQDDLPGAEAPEAWFSYLQRGDGGRLIKVVEHNRQDILSLAVIHHATGLVVQQPTRWDPDLHGLARWVLEFNEADAMQLLVEHRERLCDDGKRLLGYLYRRAERWEEAVPIWEELASRQCIESIERLAKYHEHVSKDLHAALYYCKRLPGSKHDSHRLARLEIKLQKQRRHTLFQDIDIHTG